MHDVLLLNLVFFLPATAGAAAFVWWMLRILRTPPASPGDSGSGPGVPTAPTTGPRLSGSDDDLARSA